MEAELQRHDKGVVHASKHETLRERVSYLVSLDDVGFADGLERVNTARVSLADLHHLDRG